MKVSSQYPITKYSNGRELDMMDEVVVEYELSVFVDDHLYKKILCSPDALEVLVIGELITEKIITSCDELKDIIIDEDHHIAKVYLNDTSDENKIKSQEHNDENKTIGQSVDDEHKITSDHHSERQNKVWLDQDSILSIFKSFVSSSELFKSTGGVHSCAIVNDNGILYHQDDISRQNAVNKVIGLCYKNNISLEDKLLFTSCRISSEIMKKVIHSGIKVIISKSAPTDVAIELGRKNNMILYGFARGNTMNRYTPGPR